MNILAKFEPSREILDLPQHGNIMLLSFTFKDPNTTVSLSVIYCGVCVDRKRGVLVSDSISNP